MCRKGHLAQTQGCHKTHVGKRGRLRHNGLRFVNVGSLVLEGIGSVGSEAVVDSR